jgi:hypothetical protein
MNMGPLKAACCTEFDCVLGRLVLPSVQNTAAAKYNSFVRSTRLEITGLSRQILFEGLPPQTQDLHGFFNDAEKMKKIRERLSDISWFMRALARGIRDTQCFRSFVRDGLFFLYSADRRQYSIERG